MKGCYDLGKECQFLRLLSLSAPSDFQHCNRLHQTWRQQLHLSFLRIVLHNDNVHYWGLTITRNSWELFVKSNSIIGRLMTQFSATPLLQNIQMWKVSKILNTAHMDMDCQSGSYFRTEVITNKVRKIGKIMLLLSTKLLRLRSREVGTENIWNTHQKDGQI